MLREGPAPSSRLITGLPCRSGLLKYSPFHLFAGTFCRQLKAASIRILDLGSLLLRGSVMGIPELFILLKTSATPSLGCHCLIIAQVPDTCTAAMAVDVTAVLPNPTDEIGAEDKYHVASNLRSEAPLEKGATTSAIGLASLPVAPTLMVEDVQAGNPMALACPTRQASLPAAT